MFTCIKSMLRIVISVWRRSLSLKEMFFVLLSVLFVPSNFIVSHHSPLWFPFFSHFFLRTRWRHKFKTTWFKYCSLADFWGCPYQAHYPSQGKVVVASFELCSGPATSYLLFQRTTPLDVLIHYLHKMPFFHFLLFDFVRCVLCIIFLNYFSPPITFSAHTHSHAHLKNKISYFCVYIYAIS